VRFLRSRSKLSSGTRGSAAGKAPPRQVIVPDVLKLAQNRDEKALKALIRAAMGPNTSA
jgi:hypothetical protein